MKAVKSGSFIEVAASILRKFPKGTILIGGEDGWEAGLSVELLESESDKWILNGWSLDAFGNVKSLGIGIAKDLYSNDVVEIDAGVYTTRKLRDFFSSKTSTDVKVGLSASWRL